MAENEIIAGLDLGTTKVCAIVAEQSEEGLDIIGIGSVPSKGLKKGVVVNIESTVQAIRAAVEQAETMAGVEINTVYAGIAHLTPLAKSLRTTCRQPPHTSPTTPGSETCQAIQF